MKTLFWLTAGVLFGFCGAIYVAMNYHRPVPVVVSPPPPVPVVKPQAAVIPPVQPPVPPSAAPAVPPPPRETVVTVSNDSPEESLSKLNLFEIRNQCNNAQSKWLQAHFDNYAKAPANAAEQKAFLGDLFDQLKEPLKAASWWRGETDFSTGEKIVHLEVMLKLYGSRESELGDPFKSNALAKISASDQLCYALSPYTSVDGKIENSPFSRCGNPDRKKNKAFYLTYNSYLDDKIAAAASVVLLPFPGAKVPLEYLSVTGQWLQKSNFAWRPASFEEWQKLHDQYVQSFQRLSTPKSEKDLSSSEEQEK